MNKKKKKVYSEVYQVLNVLGDEYIRRLPKSLYNMLEEKRDTTYNPKYTDEITLDMQNINKESLNILALLQFNYWCDSYEVKLELQNILEENEKIHEENLRKKYNSKNLFKNKKNVYTKEAIENNMAIVEYKENIFRKFINKIKNIFGTNRNM